MAKRNTGRRGASRKRRPASAAAPGGRRRRERRTPARRRAAPRWRAGRRAGAGAVPGERPRPRTSGELRAGPSASVRRRRGIRCRSSELLILVGAIGTIVGVRRGISHGGPRADSRPRGGRDRHGGGQPARASQRLPLAHDHARAAPGDRPALGRGARASRRVTTVPPIVNVAMLARRRARCSRSSTNCCARVSSMRAASACLRRSADGARGAQAPAAGPGRLSDGSGRSTSFAPSPRFSPVKPSRSRRAISRSPSTRAGWSAGQPGDQFRDPVAQLQREVRRRRRPSAGAHPRR